MKEQIVSKKGMAVSSEIVPEDLELLDRETPDEDDETPEDPWDQVSGAMFGLDDESIEPSTEDFYEDD